jgi:hypothetical protein
VETLAARKTHPAIRVTRTNFSRSPVAEDPRLMTKETVTNAISKSRSTLAARTNIFTLSEYGSEGARDRSTLARSSA